MMTHAHEIHSSHVTDPTPVPGEKKNYVRSFIKDRLLSVTIVSILPMILVGIIILYQFYTSYQEKVYTHLETLVNKHTLNIDTFLNEKLGNIRFLAKNVTLADLSDETFLQKQLESLQQDYGPVFVDLGIINEQGIQVAYAGPFKLGKAQYADTDWFKDASRKKHSISDVFLGLRGLPHFIITVKKEYHGQPWILRATIDFVAFNNLVENIRIGETGFAFIINKTGKFQTRPREDIDPMKYLNKEFLDTINKQEIPIAEKDGSLFNRIIYIAAFLKNGEWILIYQQSTKDAFSDFRKALKAAIIILFISSVITLTMAFIRYQKMSIQIAKTEQEKQMMNVQIVETGKLASVGELAAGIAHEINNPVAIMVEEAGWIEDLLEDDEFKKTENFIEFKRALTQIKAQGKRCKDITHKLLSFARKTDTKIQEVQLNDLLTEIVAIEAQRAKYSNVIINTHLQDDLPSIAVSQTEMQQVFLNLINNALDAMEKSGGVIEICNYKENDFIVVKIADNGKGIPEANLNRIFDPFFTTKPVGKGTGLGLSICYGIVKKLGGEIVVESIVEGGTTFWVKLPLLQRKNMVSKEI